MTETISTAGPTQARASGAADGFLRVIDVTVRFGGLTALDGVTFDVRRGAIHAVIGPNGAGKSTLFNVLNGFYRATSGSVVLEDVELTGKRPHDVARLGVGRTFQHPGLFKGMGVMENLMIGRHVAMRSGFVAAGLRLPVSRREERTSRERIHRLAELMQVTHVLHRRADEIAYGEQKRVELVRALALEPKVLLLDEPVAGMNAAETQQMGAIIEQVRAEFDVTIVLVEHDMGMVMSLAERITVLDFGRVIAEGNPAEVQADPEVKRAYLGF